MSALLDVAAALFADRAWAHAPDATYPDTLELRFDIGVFRWKSYAQAKEGDRVFVFYSVSPENVPPERRAVAAEYLERVSWGLLVGNFEMDWSDGEVRFKTSVDLRGEAPSRALLAGVVEANLDCAGRYLPGLQKVVRGELSPEAAFADAEEDG